MNMCYVASNRMGVYFEVGFGGLVTGFYLAVSIFFWKGERERVVSKVVSGVCGCLFAHTRARIRTHTRTHTHTHTHFYIIVWLIRMGLEDLLC